MTIRNADRDDMPELLRMAEAFVEHSPHRSLGFDADSVEGLMSSLMDMGEGYLSIGHGAMLGGLITPLFFNHNKRVAGELFMWSEGGGQASKLIKHFQQWAKRQGCVICSLTMLEGEGQSDPSHLYRNLGFERAERGYQKVL